jgi:probable F420-dependent oxidoreductase
VPTPARVSVRPPGWIAGESASFEDILGWAQRAEALGFDGVFFGDRLLSEAVSDGSPVYAASMLDVTVLVSAVLARTRRLRVGPLVLVLPFRHPVQLAKTLASLQAASGGRLVVGAGLGWNPHEFEVLGVPRSERGARFEETLTVLRALWSGERVSHDGRFWSFDDVQIWPSVAADPPPVWMASFSPGSALDWQGDDFPATVHRQLDRVGRLADGWVPLVYSASAKRRLSAEALGAAWTLVQEAAARAGRPDDSVDLVYSDWVYVLDGPGSEQRCQAALDRFFAGTWEEARRTYTIGTAQEVADRIRDHTACARTTGAVREYILTPLSDDPHQLDLLAGVAPQLRG